MSTTGSLFLRLSVIFFSLTIDFRLVNPHSQKGFAFKIRHLSCFMYLYKSTEQARKFYALFFNIEFESEFRERKTVIYERKWFFARIQMIWLSVVSIKFYTIASFWLFRIWHDGTENDAKNELWWKLCFNYEPSTWKRYILTC